MYHSATTYRYKYEVCTSCNHCAKQKKTNELFKKLLKALGALNKVNDLYHYIITLPSVMLPHF